MEVETAKEEETFDDKIANDLIKKQGFFDPTLELASLKCQT